MSVSRVEGGEKTPTACTVKRAVPHPWQRISPLPPKHGKAAYRRSLPHPHSQSPLVLHHFAQVSNISRVQPRCPKTVSLMLFYGFDRFLAVLLLQIKFYFLVQTSLRWMWCVFDVILFTLSVSPRGETCTKWQVRSQNFNCTPICIIYWMAFSS